MIKKPLHESLYDVLNEGLVKIIKGQADLFRLLVFLGAFTVVLMAAYTVCQTSFKAVEARQVADIIYIVFTCNIFLMTVFCSLNGTAKAVYGIFTDNARRLKTAVNLFGSGMSFLVTGLFLHLYRNAF